MPLPYSAGCKKNPVHLILITYRISYADAFAMALAGETGGEIVTRDPEIIEVCNGGRFLLDQIPSE